MRYDTAGKWTSLEVAPPLTSAGKDAFRHARIAVTTGETICLASEAVGVYRAIPDFTYVSD